MLEAALPAQVVVGDHTGTVTLRARDPQALLSIRCSVGKRSSRAQRWKTTLETHGKLMENSWKTYGTLTGNSWRTHGKLMENS